MSGQPYKVEVLLMNGGVDFYSTLWHYSVGRSGNLTLNLYTPERGMFHVTYAKGMWKRVAYV